MDFFDDNHKVQQVLEALPVGILILDANQAIVYTNKAARNYMNLRRQGAIARAEVAHNYELLHENGKPFNRNELPSVVAQKKGKAEAIMHYRRKSKSLKGPIDRWLLVQAFTIGSGKNKHVVNITEEVSQIKQAEIEVREANRRITDILASVLKTE